MHQPQEGEVKFENNYSNEDVMRIFKLAKITSEDCVNWIVSNVAPETLLGCWKRRSKRKVGASLVRAFENSNTGDMVEVVEQNGQIVSGRAVGSTEQVPSVAAPQSRRDRRGQRSIYYVIAQTYEGLTGAELEIPLTLLYVTDAAEFDTEGHLSDETPQGTFEELERLGYDGGEFMESVIEIHPRTPGVPRTYDLANITEWSRDILSRPSVPVNLDDFKTKLASSSVFRFNPSFQTFMLEHITGGESTVIIPI